MTENSDKLTQTLEEVYNIAGSSLSKVLDAYCPKDKDLLVKWFYDSNNKGLGKSPADFCKEEGSYKLECILMDLAYGNLGL
ncbi:MAG: hypothetical protein AABX24_05090 [Nanoarchaeota archaeon]